MRLPRKAFAATVGLIVVTALLGGCIIQVSDNQNDNNNGGPPPAQKITVRIVNDSNTTLDAEIYISATPATVDELFAAGNKFTAFGVGTLGLLGADSSATIEIDCANIRVIGTKGGRFGDNLNNPQGTGRQIVLTQDLNLFCGGSVTFTYDGSGSNFTTTFDVKP